MSISGFSPVQLFCQLTLILPEIRRTIAAQRGHFASQSTGLLQAITQGKLDIIVYG